MELYIWLGNRFPDAFIHMEEAKQVCHECAITIRNSLERMGNEEYKQKLSTERQQYSKAKKEKKIKELGKKQKRVLTHKELNIDEEYVVNVNVGNVGTRQNRKIDSTGHNKGKGKKKEKKPRKMKNKVL